MRLILEGPDCAGKSTMAKELAERLKLDIIKSTYYGPKNISAYRERLACQDVVIDRCWISEVIYSKYFFHHSEVDDFTDRMLCDICVKQNIPIVVMLPPIDVIIQRMIERGDDFYSVVYPNVGAIYQEYVDYCAARSFIHVFRDYNPDKLVDFLLKNAIKD